MMAQLKGNDILGAWFLQINAMGQDLPDPLSALFVAAIAENCARAVAS
ncbi:MAG: hypothetical protein RLZZ136_176 [Pseudomonadota bacterium]